MEYNKKELNQKFNVIESHIHSKIINAKSAFYQLALSLSQKSIVKGNKKVDDLISHFWSQPEYEAAFPISGIILLGDDDKIVADNMFSKTHSKLGLISLPGCYKISRESAAFELNALPIVIEEVLKVPLIPLIIKIEDSEKKHISTICSGLKVEKINDMLQLRYNKILYSNEIKVVNKSVYNLSDNDLNNKTKELFSFKAIIKTTSKIID